MMERDRGDDNVFDDLNRLHQVFGKHLVPGTTGPFDQQLAQCESRMTEISDQLESAEGDRHRFLTTAFDRWQGTLEILRRNTVGAERDSIEALQQAFPSVYSRARVARS